MAFRFPYAPGAFSLDKITKRRGSKKNEPKHLEYIRDLPCSVCGSVYQVEAAHVRMPSPGHNKPSTAYGQKPADRWTVPLCERCHRTGPDAQHGMRESDWWEGHGIDPCGLATGLRCISGDNEAGAALIAATRLRSAVKGRRK